MRSLSIFLAFVFLSAATESKAVEPEHFWASPNDIEVIDGDTIYAAGQIIHLRGIDSPEIGQECDHNGHLWSCGMTAALDLHKIISMAKMTNLHCWVYSKNNRWADATCYLGEKDIAASLINSGMTTTTQSASPHYMSLKHQTTSGPMGIWGSQFRKPSSWAKGIHLENEKGKCVFKAFTLSKGQRVFVGPLSPSYTKVKSPKTIYCSDEEALRAGYNYYRR